MNNCPAPPDIDARFELANRLAASGIDADMERAKSLYLEIIDQLPDNLGAWVNLGILLFETGYIRASATAFSAAIAYHPEEAAPYAYLGNVQLYKNELEEAQKNYLKALRLKADYPEAHQGLASICQRQGDAQQAALHRKLGFGHQPVSQLSFRGTGTPTRLLVLSSATDGNIPWRLLIDRNLFEATIVAVEYFDRELPPHDLVFNAIGDADLCRDELEKARRLLESSDSALINPPAAVLKTGRLDNAARLAQIPGVRLPRMRLVSKHELRSGEIGAFPYLLRSPGFHGGSHFVRVDSRDQLLPALEKLPGEKLLAIEFLDAQGDDGMYRKYRVMCIGSRLYPVHMAISAHWNVHYFSSQMDRNAQYRKEESVFLNDFEQHLGKNTVAALAQIGSILALDYCGIDFGIGKDGQILLYEANATMVINPPSHEERWDYRRDAINNALSAARALFSLDELRSKTDPRQDSPTRA